MNTQNHTPRGRKDVFHAFLAKNASFVGTLEIPTIRTSNKIPNKIIPFSEAMHTCDYDCWVCFYEDDWRFECLWNNPTRYLARLKKFRGVISPDYSLYSDMPLVLQYYNIYRNHLLAHWLTENGIEVLPNVRWGDSRTFKEACLGIEKNKTIVVGTQGCIKSLQYKKEFIDGLDYVVEQLHPKTIIVYGSAPNKIFSLARMYGIEILQFDSQFHRTHNKGDARDG